MFELLGLMLIFLSALCVGGWFLRKADLHPTERIALGISLGLGVLGLVIFALGVARLLYEPVLLGVGVVAPLAVTIWRGRKGNLAAWITELREDFREIHRGSSRTEVLLVVFALLLMTVLNLSEAITWDTCPDRYHVIIARSYLNHHRIFNQPGNMLLIYPELWESVYILGLCFAPETPPVLHTGTAVLTYLLLFAVGRRLVSVRAGLFAALLYGATAIVHRISPMGYNDLPLALFSLAAVYSAIRFALDPRFSWAALSGVFIGFGFGCKSSAVPYVLPPVLVLVVVPLLFRRHLKTAAGGATAVVALAALFLSPWPLRCALETGNPLYPYAIHSLHTDERYVCEAEKFHGKFQVDPKERYHRFRRELNFTWYSVMTEGCGSLALFPLAAIAWAWMHRRRPELWLVLLYPVWGLLIYTVLAPRWVRYFLPAMPGVILVTGCAAGWLVDGVRSSGLTRKGIALGLSVVTMLNFLFAARTYRGRIATWPPLTPGARERQLTRLIPDQIEKIRYLNQHLDDRARVLSHGRSPRYRYLRVPFLVPHHWCPDLWTLLFDEGKGAEEKAEALRSFRITHVLAWKPANKRLEPFYLKVATWRDAYLLEIQHDTLLGGPSGQNP